ncbi:MAG: hypothetical protein SGARI_007360, partial [Bacillariaceae sp.]
MKLSALLFASMALVAKKGAKADHVATIDLLGDDTFPTGIMNVDENTVLVGAFGDASIQKVDLASGEVVYFSPPSDRLRAEGLAMDNVTRKLYSAVFDADISTIIDDGTAQDVARDGEGIDNIVASLSTFGSQIRVFDVDTAELLAVLPVEEQFAQ